MQLIASHLDQRSRFIGMLILVTCCVVTRPVAGDETTGSWSGAGSLRGNYFYENSTRVMMPSISLALESPEGLRLRGGYLFDAITSASIGQGAGADVAFTEVRHQGDVGVGKSFRVGEDVWDLDGGVRVSGEPDYTSVAGHVSSRFSWGQKTRALNLSLAYSHDEVRRNVRGGPLAGVDAAFNERLDAFVASVGFDRVISSTFTAGVNYQLTYLEGFLANAYRLSVTGQRESHPHTRLRHTLNGNFTLYLPAQRAALKVLYRAYLDSWNVAAITPEIRYYQELGEHLQLRFRYRYHRQTRAYFYSPDLVYAPDAELVSMDPKMSAFETQLLGFQIRTKLSFIGWGFLDEATFDINVAHVWNTNRFGNAVIAQTGVHIPF